MDAHTADFRRRWEVTQVRVITRDGADVGWLQTRTEGDAFFLAQLFVEGSFHGQGIGTEVMRLIIAEAAGANQAVTLGVVKTQSGDAALSAARFPNHA